MKNVLKRNQIIILVIALMLLFYATPIVYSSDMLPEKFQAVMKLNPMSQVIDAYRDILFYHNTPDYKGLGILALISVIGLIISNLIFKKLKKNFVEEL